MICAVFLTRAWQSHATIQGRGSMIVEGLNVQYQRLHSDTDLRVGCEHSYGAAS